MSPEQREFTDPDQLAEALPGRSGRLRVLGRGAFRAELTVGELGCLTLQFARESLARVAFHAMPADRVGVLGWPRGEQAPIVGGAQMRVGDVISIGRGAESFHWTPGSVDYVALIVDANLLAGVAIDLTGRELSFEDGLVFLQSDSSTARLLSLLCARWSSRSWPP